MYDSFTEAKELQWECDKCKYAFSKYPYLKEHKTEKHSYQNIISPIYNKNFKMTTSALSSYIKSDISMR